jgi:hypothetical protein
MPMKLLKTLEGEVKLTNVLFYIGSMARIKLVIFLWASKLYLMYPSSFSNTSEMIGDIAHKLCSHYFFCCSVRFKWRGLYEQSILRVLWSSRGHILKKLYRALLPLSLCLTLAYNTCSFTYSPAKRVYYVVFRRTNNVIFDTSFCTNHL